MHIPKLCPHKASGRGYATDPLSKKEVYFGVYGSAECEQAYGRWLLDLLARRREVASGTPPGSKVRLRDLCEDFMAYARARYAKHGKQTSEVGSCRRICDLAVKLYGSELVGDFGPRKFKAVRSTLIANEPPLARGYVNRQMGRLVEVFRWGVEMELVEPAVLHVLREVAPLERGRTPCPEEQKVTPVSLEIVQRSLEVARPKLAQMIRLQLAASMRPVEVCIMRLCDIDQSSLPWLYIPWTHKTEHRDRQRRIQLGPQARAVLEPLLRYKPSSWLFPGHPRTKPLNENTYSISIARLCKRHGIPHWFPLQLRHTGLTLVRRAYGLEGSQVIAGHADADVTQVYAERDEALARKIAEEIG